MTTPPRDRPKESLQSDFAGDPDMREIIGMFVSEMPERIDRLRKHWEEGQLENLKRVAHQLKGASGGYGYPAVGEAAGRLEKSLRSLLDSGAPIPTAQLQSELGQLLDLCRRVLHT